MGAERSVPVAAIGDVRLPNCHGRFPRVGSMSWPDTGEVLLHDNICYAALAARDPRFDGRFFVGVLSTGIFCRPVCPARTPQRRNVRFFASAAAAVADGFRSCQRCRPDTMPGSRRWDGGGDLADRALRMIEEGAAQPAESSDRPIGAVANLAATLHISERQLRRILVERAGATPQQLLAARRAQTARMLVEQTQLPMLAVSEAAGFSSLRQFNDGFARHFGAPPSRLRAAAAGAARGQGPAASAARATQLSLRLAVREPYDSQRVLRWWARHAIDGIDDVRGPVLRTSFADGAAVELLVRDSSVTVNLDDVALTSLTTRVATVAAALDTAANPAAIADALSAIPSLAPVVQRWPGLRIPSALDPWRAAAMAVLGQQVSVTAATRLAARLASLAGDPNRFPRPETVRQLGAELIGASVRMPRTRAAALVEMAGLVADGDLSLDGSGDLDEIAERLLGIRGIGPWTVAEVRLRALRDPDVWPEGDAVLTKAVGHLGGLDPDAARPWRSYLAHYLWAFAHDRRAVVGEPDPKTQQRSEMTS